MVIPGNVILISSHKSACQEPKQPEQLRAAVPYHSHPRHGRASSSLPGSPALVQLPLFSLLGALYAEALGNRMHLISCVTILALSKEPLNSGDKACSQAADSEWPGSRWAFQVRKCFSDRCGLQGTVLPHPVSSTAVTKHSAGGTGGRQREFTGELRIGDNSFACLGAQKKITRKKHENHHVTVALQKRGQENVEQDSGLVVIVTPHVQLFLWVKVPRETPAGGRGAPPHHTATFTACGAGLSGLHSYSLHPTISKPDYDAPPQEHGRAQETCCPFILIVRSDKQNTQT